MKEAIYAGERVRLAAGAASRALLAAVRAVVEAEVGGSLDGAQARLGRAGLFQATLRARQALGAARFVALARAVMAEAGVDPEGCALDVPRLRAIADGGHLEPAAAPAYYAHRDTWYANPRAQLNWWIPLHDVEAAATFRLFPDAFGRAVPNDSHRFDYDAWSRAAGFGRAPAEAAAYPRALAPLDGERAEPVAARAGDVLVFSGAHLHEPCKNMTGRARFSVDFRSVCLEDHARGRGAPDPDNRSTGSALADYVRP